MAQTVAEVKKIVNSIDEEHYMAFVLDEDTRQKLVEAIGEHFNVRVCHHITLAYDVPKDAMAVDRLFAHSYYNNNFVAVGYRKDDKNVVIEVATDGGGSSRCNFNQYVQTPGKLHITYERLNSVTDQHSNNLFSNEVAYIFVPFVVKLSGEFQLLKKNGHTPTQVLYAPILFAQGKNQGEGWWPSASNSARGEPMYFQYRDKDDQVHYTERDEVTYKRVLQAYLQEKSKAPLELHQMEKPNFSSELFQGVGWVACDFTAEGNPMSFVYRNKFGPSVTLEMSMDPESGYQKLFKAWKKRKEAALKYDKDSLFGGSAF